MDQRLSQNQSQKMILAPQLRQFLKLLELPIFELEQKVQEELEQNPVLEETKSTSEDETSLEPETPETPKEEEPVRDILREMESLDRARNYESMSSDLSHDGQEDLQKKRDYQESILTKPPTLEDYLNWQVGLLELSPNEKEIAAEIIGNINDDGQLAASLEEIAKEARSTVQEAEQVLAKIQSLDPPGVGGRDLKETLLIQLQKLEGDTSLAQMIVSEYLPLLERKQFDQLARAANISQDRIKEIAKQIGRLEPKPGRVFYYEKPNYVVPDAEVSLSEDNEDELVIELNHDFIPSLRINREYRLMLKDKNLDPKAKAFLREKVQAALDLIKALSQRKSTLRLITEEIVKLQRDFFTKGFAYLKPLRLKDIAERVKVHESTVSRAIQNKYLDTPQGTIPYKSFFSNRLESTNGTSESQTSAMERLKHLIANENKKKPLSDAKLMELLSQEGVKVARRTVAKYRDMLKILPAYLRKS
jgi:RNA polymerase sigma-54 factor